MPKTLIALATAAALAAPVSVLAAAAETPKEIIIQKYGDATAAKLYKYDTAVPTAPALALVEGAPELTVTSPFGPDFNKDVVLSGEKPGFALAARPYWTLTPNTQSLAEYRAMNRAMLILARTTLSLAGAQQATEDTKGFGAAIGLHTELLNRADPRFNPAHNFCLALANTKFVKDHIKVDEFMEVDPDTVAEGREKALALQPGASQALKDEIGRARYLKDLETALSGDLQAMQKFADWQAEKNDELRKASKDDPDGKRQKALDACFKRGALAAENFPSFQLGVGSAWKSPDYGFSDLKSAGTSAWLAFRVPIKPYGACADPTVENPVLKPDPTTPRDQQCLSPPGNVTAFAHFASNDKVKFAGADQKAATSQAGVVLSHQSSDKNWSLAASAVWIQQDYDDAKLKTEDFNRYALSYSQKVYDNIWLEASFGETSGREATLNKKESFGLVRLSFK